MKNDQKKFERNIIHYTKEGERTVHWIWQGRLNRGKYPTWFDGEKEITARRAALTLYRFVVPSKRRIINTCGVALCVHPDHQEVAGETY